MKWHGKASSWLSAQASDVFIHVSDIYCLSTHQPPLAETQLLTEHLPQQLPQPQITQKAIVACLLSKCLTVTCLLKPDRRESIWKFAVGLADQIVHSDLTGLLCQCALTVLSHTIGTPEAVSGI